MKLCYHYTDNYTIKTLGGNDSYSSHEGASNSDTSSSVHKDSTDSKDNKKSESSKENKKSAISKKDKAQKEEKDLDSGTIIVLEGQGQKVPAEFKGTISIRIDAESEDFIDVEVNDKVVNPKYYFISDGKLVLTFTEDYVASLKEGEYKVRCNFKNGYAETWIFKGEIEPEVTENKNSNKILIGIGAVVEHLLSPEQAL